MVQMVTIVEGRRRGEKERTRAGQCQERSREKDHERGFGRRLVFFVVRKLVLLLVPPG